MAKRNARTNIIYKTKYFFGDKFKLRRSEILMANEEKLNPEIMHCKLAKLYELKSIRSIPHRCFK